MLALDEPLSQHLDRRCVLDFQVVTERLRFWPFCLTLLFFICGGFALAQQCDGYVSLDGKLLAGETACFFGPTKHAETAYIRTDHLTAALGLESDYLVDTGVLRFKKGHVTLDVQTTDQPTQALVPAAGAVKVNGVAQKGRKAILAGSSYVPLAEVVHAFGGELAWNAAASLTVIDFSAARAAPAVPAAPASADDASLRLLGEPRYAVHNEDESYTRVAVDVPQGLRYDLAVDGKNFIILFQGAKAAPFEVTPESEQLSSIGYRQVAGTGLVALIISGKYDMKADGSGFRVGAIAGEDNAEILYVDFAPALHGEKVARLPELPASQPALVKPPKSVVKTVVIDPGHGGKDPGAMSDYVVEKDLVLAVGLLLRDRLEAKGIKVEMTRDDDRFVELEDRAAYAVPSKHNLFVSLHANATEDGEAKGIETWVFGEPQDDSLINLAVLENGGGDVGRARTDRAAKVAASIDGDLLREENLAYSTVLAKNVQQDLIKLTGSADRGIRENYFVVIRDARVPAVLVELGFVNNSAEGPKLASDSYREELADALTAAIEQFLLRGVSVASAGP